MPPPLIEPTRTNLFARSAAFDDAAWTKSPGTASVVANSIAAPDGTTTADTFREGSALGTNYLSQAVAFVSGQPYAVSYHAKQKERTAARIEFNAAAFASNPRAQWNLATGAIISAAGTATWGIQALGDDWYRIWGVATATATVSSIAALMHYNGAASYQGDGASGIYAWGAQCEIGTFPSSYIATAGAPVTRLQPSIVTRSPILGAVRSPIRYPAGVA